MTNILPVVELMATIYILLMSLHCLLYTNLLRKQQVSRHSASARAATDLNEQLREAYGDVESPKVPGYWLLPIGMALGFVIGTILPPPSNLPSLEYPILGINSESFLEARSNWSRMDDSSILKIEIAQAKNQKQSSKRNQIRYERPEDR